MTPRVVVCRRVNGAGNSKCKIQNANTVLQPRREVESGRSGKVMWLEIKDEAKPVFNVLQQLASKPANRLSEEVAIDGNDLRNVGDRVLREARRFGGNKHVAGGLDEPEVRGEHDSDDGLKPAPIERVILYDQERPPEARFGPGGLTELRPPHLATFDYQALRSIERR